MDSQIYLPQSEKLNIGYLSFQIIRRPGVYVIPDDVEK